MSRALYPGEARGPAERDFRSAQPAELRRARVVRVIYASGKRYKVYDAHSLLEEDTAGQGSRPGHLFG